MSREAVHGTLSSYTNDCCRCEDCRRIWAQYIRNRRTRKKFGLPTSVRKIRDVAEERYGSRG